MPDSISQTIITDYTAAKVATVLHTAGTAFSTGALMQIPINVLYGPTSDETAYKTANGTVSKGVEFEVNGARTISVL